MFLVLATSFILFLSFALAFMFGKMLGGIGIGFFIVAAFYGILGIVLHFVIHKWIKRRIRNYFNKQLLN
jgi:Na+/melibiose symporter-like transporter